MFSTPAEEYRNQGYEEQQKGRFDKALTLYEKAIALGNDSAVIFNDIGVVYDYLGMSQKAEENYLKAIEKDPEYLPPYTNLAFYYKDRGQKGNAIYYFQERLKRAASGDPWAEQVRQELYQLDPQIRERELLRQAEEMNARVAEDMARQAFAELSADIARSRNHLTHGQELFSEQKYDEAVEEYDRALAVTPGNPRVLEARKQAIDAKNVARLKNLTETAMNMLNEGDMESAQKEFQQILATFPDHSE